MRGVISGVLQALASLLCFIGSVRSTSHSQNGCYNTDVMLSCPYYTQNKPGKLVWRFYDQTASKWAQIASIRNGNLKVTSANTALDGRSAIHPNGSLEITSLHPDDETQYLCIVKQEGRKLHMVKLSVTCGKVTQIEQVVCADSDIVLECDAKHRTNPRKLDQVKWHKKNTSGNDVSWSLLVASNGSNVTVGDGFKLHGNGSLLVQGGRDQSVVIFKCIATKNLLSLPDTHIVVVKNVKCRREKRQTSGTTVKTTAGRVAMTTPIVVSMDTTTPTLPSRASNSLVHWNETWLLHAIIGLALIGIVRYD